MKYKNITQKKGDTGFTDLCLGGRVSKIDPRIDVVGEIDEFHATLGLCRNDLDGITCSHLNKIQLHLTLLMGEISTADENKQKYRETFDFVSNSHLKYIDDLLNYYAGILDDLNRDQRGWAYYGHRGIPAAKVDHAGTVCRRCERRVVALSDQFEIREEILAYLNRLSKVLYLIARFFEN